MQCSEEISAVEARATALRMTIGEVCAAANVHPTVWSKAKGRGTIRPKTLGRMEDALDRLEAAKIG